MSAGYIWAIILILGVGTYLIRFSFLGLIGGRDLPEWVLRHLRYTAVAVLPGLVAPLVLWPSATNGEIDPARLSAALVTFGVGLLTRNVIAAILAGGGTLFAMIAIMGAY
ncbi:AzlD domain-containing protein [Octadecabacter sp. 1_MG-2023]|uniref:AzlD domain-containing protein n=1 Tax=unclassified Octadecabacter TaxID=196158 RepID=UPI001C08F3C4|nr:MULTISPECIES: AzlD domain-containing protein [unclassified Octadecabacter]MBU2994152.1 AzlD domain-containing protein [Octadecabacter sp. B2R22]MDO6734559.1 AzlD domain-containing protein [Octadecabacter sp. 1_MG-2023]